MPTRLFFSATLIAVSFAPAFGQTVQPTVPPSLAVKVGDAVLNLDPPEIEVFQAADREGNPPEAPQGNKTIGLTPLYDPTRTHILGSLFRTFRPETLKVTREDGTAYQREVDFTFNEENGTLANKDGRLQGKVKAQAEGALQRLDLIQLDASGKPSVKKGTSVWVCPELPEPDPGHTALAGVYLAPWRTARNPFYDQNPEAIAGAGEYAVTEHEIAPIRPADPVPVVHPERLEKTLARLRAGEPVKIAFMGDSILLGAESTRWWNDQYDANSKTWKGRFVHGLRTRFPQAKIEVVEAYRGGVPIAYAEEKIGEVLAQKPDLVVMSFGVNDADPGLGKKTPEQFGEALGKLMDQTRAAGGEFLFVTPFPLIPWVGNGQGERVERQFLPVMKTTADAHGAALVDVDAEYRNLNTHGIPWWSQNHNWHNHPGDFGHRVYAETALRGFPQ